MEGGEKTPAFPVAVMGVTGSGNITFIHSASQLLNVGIGHDLESRPSSPSLLLKRRSLTAKRYLDGAAF